MIEPLLKLKVIQRGTHVLPVAEWNNDRPNPCECVAEALFDVEFRLNELMKAGGALNAPEAYHSAQSSLFGLNLALNAASNQGWKLELELNSEERVKV